MEAGEGIAADLSNFGKDRSVVAKINIQCADSADKAVSCESPG